MNKSTIILIIINHRRKESKDSPIEFLSLVFGT